MSPRAVDGSQGSVGRFRKRVHDPEGVKDVWFALFIELPVVRVGRDLNGSVQVHWNIASAAELPRHAYSHISRWRVSQMPR